MDGQTDRQHKLTWKEKDQNATGSIEKLYFLFTFLFPNDQIKTNAGQGLVARDFRPKFGRQRHRFL